MSAEGRKCVICGKALDGMRGDATTCSSKCRAVKHRLKIEVKANLEGKETNWIKDYPLGELSTIEKKLISLIRRGRLADSLFLMVTNFFYVDDKIYRFHHSKRWSYRRPLVYVLDRNMPEI